MLSSKPLNYCQLSQPFGANAVSFYKEMGLKGHQGTDFICVIDTPCYAVFDGIVVQSTSDTPESATKGRFIYIESDPAQEGDQTVKYQALYFHLNHTEVKVGDRVTAGQRIGLTGNTGRYTTGPHLHFGIYKYIKLGEKFALEQPQNGYHGAIDPEPLFQKGWIVNPTQYVTKNKIKGFEGMLLKAPDSPVVYLAKSGNLIPFPDELTVWSNGYSLSEINAVDEDIVKTANVQGNVELGNKIKPQIIKEMVALLGDNPERAKELFAKYFL